MSHPWIQVDPGLDGSSDWIRLSVHVVCEIGLCVMHSSVNMHVFTSFHEHNVRDVTTCQSGG